MKPVAVSKDPRRNEATRRRTRAQRRAETERRVLDETTRLVAEGGVRSVTLAAVGEEAGYFAVSPVLRRSEEGWRR